MKLLKFLYVLSNPSIGQRQKVAICFCYCRKFSVSHSIINVNSNPLSVIVESNCLPIYKRQSYLCVNTFGRDLLISRR